mmetsp:Transcript_24201/g.42816  ORF Transcript_24201/g.42816 Transcript_24201/m.42816 type:complete len:273 (-) Transcript_24201:399-1217(-)
MEGRKEFESHNQREGVAAEARDEHSYQQWAFAEPGRSAADNKGRSKDLSSHVTDEVFSTASHMTASMFSFVGMMVLVSASCYQGNPWKIVSFIIYGLSMLFLFVSSTLHHGLHSSPTVNHTLRMLDYLAIFPFIAGTFTPLCLVYLHNTWVGWCFFAVIWMEATFGIVMVAIFYWKLHKWINLVQYMCMGWTGAFLAVPLYPHIGMSGLTLLILGGIAYTVGGAIFILEKPNPIPGKFGFHEIWHVFVMLGAGLHWIMMFYCVLPAPETKIA